MRPQVVLTLVVDRPTDVLLILKKGGCGSFYAISIAHESFKGLSTIKQHRVVNELLKEEIKGMHGLQVSRISPSIRLLFFLFLETKR